MATGVKLHFCPVLWSSNGGPLDSKGRPVDPKHRLTIITNTDIAYHDLKEELAEASGQNYEHPYARGKCDVDYDCAQCDRLEKAIITSGFGPDQINWVCVSCAGMILRRARKEKLPLLAPGNYGEGVCMYHRCDRPPRVEEAEGAPGISTGIYIDTPPGYSRFLQLILGPLNTLL